MCGDYSEEEQEQAAAMGSPLRVRGLLGIFKWSLLFIRITPACAGTTLNVLSFQKVLRDHPCMCGDYSTHFRD